MGYGIEKLTLLKVQRATEPGKLGDGGGLYLQITSSGVKSWIFRYERHAREHYMGLGPLHTIGLAEAREAAHRARKCLFQGIDPLARKRQRHRRRSAPVESKRFDACAEQYMKEQAAAWRSEKHRRQWASTLRDYVYPYFGAVDVRKVDTASVLNALQTIWTTKTETATRVRERIERVLAWATAHGYREGSNPARWDGHLEMLLPAPTRLRRVRHHAALPFRDIGELMKVLREQPGAAVRALEFTIFTACRSGEVLGATWEEIDLVRKVWTLPPERTKSGRAHKVPLSTAALKVLAAQAGQGCGYVFPNLSGKNTLSPTAMTEVLKRVGAEEVTVHGLALFALAEDGFRCRRPKPAVTGAWRRIGRSGRALGTSPGSWAGTTWQRP